jgi:hypothetical protein
MLHNQTSKSNDKSKGRENLQSKRDMTHYKLETLIGLPAKFSSEAMKFRRESDARFKMKKMNASQEFYIHQMTFKNEGEARLFQDRY